MLKPGDRESAPLGPNPLAYRDERRDAGRVSKTESGKVSQHIAPRLRLGILNACHASGAVAMSSSPASSIVIRPSEVLLCVAVNGCSMAVNQT